MRVAELKLLLEGRNESRDAIQSFLKEFGDEVERWEKWRQQKYGIPVKKPK